MWQKINIVLAAHQGKACFHPSSVVQQKHVLCIKVSVLFYTRRSARKILDRVLRSDDFICSVTVLEQRTFLLGYRSPAAPIDSSCKRGEPVQGQDVDAVVSCWILKLWYEQQSAGSQIAPAFAAASFLGFSKVHLRLCPNLSWLRTCGCFLACTGLHAICVHNLRNCFSYFSPS